MRLVKTDIDQILENTLDIEDDTYTYIVTIIEIDKLLERTKDW